MSEIIDDIPDCEACPKACVQQFVIKVNNLADCEKPSCTCDNGQRWWINQSVSNLKYVFTDRWEACDGCRARHSADISSVDYRIGDVNCERGIYEGGTLPKKTKRFLRLTPMPF